LLSLARRASLMLRFRALSWVRTSSYAASNRARASPLSWRPCVRRSFTERVVESMRESTCVSTVSRLVREELLISRIVSELFKEVEMLPAAEEARLLAGV
jgi:hypothetical protein